MVFSVMIEISNDFKTHFRYCELLLDLINPFVSSVIHLEISPEEIDESILKKKLSIKKEKKLKTILITTYLFLRPESETVHHFWF